jgi:CRP/FNR family transcriptional regulator
MSDTTALLKDIPLFHEFGDEALVHLAERCVTRDVPAGTVLFTAGEEPRGLYIVRTGRVRIFRISATGREQVLHVEGARRPVAELPLFDGAPYPASAITLEDCRLVFLPRADFEHAYRSNPDVAQAIIRALGRRLRHLVHVTETLAFRDVAARLALLLAGYADEGGKRTTDGVEVTMHRTQEEIALEIGAARESVSRALRQLLRKGLVRQVDRDRLLIPDVERLRTIAAPGSRARD